VASKTKARSLDDIVNMLEQVRQLQEATGARIVIQGRELINHSEEGIALKNGQVLEPMRWFCILDPWLIPTREDGCKLTSAEAARIREELRGPANLVCEADIREWLDRETERLQLDIIWHNILSIGLEVASRDIDVSALPGLRIFYLDGADSSYFERVVRILSRHEIAYVWASQVFTGPAFPMVVSHLNTRTRWSIFMPYLTVRQVLKRLSEELGSKLQWRRPTPNSIGLTPFTNEGLCDFGLQYFYGNIFYDYDENLWEKLYLPHLDP
jgi:hypothetical protein